MKILRSIVVGVAIGFSAAFVTELVLEATNASTETRNKVHKAADVVTSAAMITAIVV